MAQNNGQQYAQLGYSQGTTQCLYGVGNNEYQSYGLVHSGSCCSTSTILAGSTNSTQMGFSDPGSHFHSPRSSSHKRSKSSGSSDQLLDRDERRSRRLHKAHKKKLKSRSSYSSAPSVPEAAGRSIGDDQMQVQYFQSAAAMSIFAQEFRAEETEVERFEAAQSTLSNVRAIIKTEQQIEITQIASHNLEYLQGQAETQYNSSILTKTYISQVHVTEALFSVTLSTEQTTYESRTQQSLIDRAWIGHGADLNCDRSRGDILSSQLTAFQSCEVMSKVEQSQCQSSIVSSQSNSTGHDVRVGEGKNLSNENIKPRRDLLYHTQLPGEEICQGKVGNVQSDPIAKREHSTAQGYATETSMAVQPRKHQSRKRHRSSNMCSESPRMQRQDMEIDQKQVEYARSKSMVPKPRDSKESKHQVLTVVPQDISAERVQNESL